MTFGQIIKSLRRKADMTQEELADMLSITGQAVSRWENDFAMPDISLLPVLANLFGVTTDYLLGVDITRKESKIQEILRNAHQKGKSGYHAEAAELIRAGLKEYPGSYKLMYELMFHLHSSADGHSDKEEQKRLLKEPVSLGEKILAECTDDSIRHNTIGQLCSCYAQLDEPEKMRKLAESMPDLWHTREFLLALYTQGDEQYEAKCRQMQAILNAAVVTLSQLHFRHDTRGTWENLAPKDILENEKNALIIADILCPDGDFGTLDFTRIHAFYTMASIYFDAEEWDAGMEQLEKAVSLALYLDEDYDDTRHHTSPLFCGQRYGSFIPNVPETFCHSFLHMLSSQAYFDRLLATEKGRDLIARLEARQKNTDRS